MGGRKRMKVCPVCKAKAFDDAAICYGCLYRFDRGGSAAVGGLDGGAMGVSCASSVAEEPPPECYRENQAFATPARAAASDGLGRHAAIAASPPAVEAEARWRRGADGRWWLRVDVALPRAGA